MASVGACVLALLFLSTPRTPVQAAAATKLPPAADIIAKHLKAVGGREAILKHASTRMKGTWDMPAQAGASGEFELVQAKPNKRVMRLKLASGGGEIVNGFDGTIGWVTSPFAPPTLMEGKLLEQTRDEADYYAMLHNPTNYQSMETVARAPFDNRECFEIKLITKSGREEHEFFDAKTGLLAGVRGVQEAPQGSSQVTLTCAEYQKFGDLQQVSKLKISSDQGELSIKIASVEYDTVKDAETTAPPEVKALVKSPKP